MNLHAFGKARGIDRRLIGRIAKSIADPAERGDSIFFHDGVSPPPAGLAGYMAILSSSESLPDLAGTMPTVWTVKSLDYLADGDVVLLTPSGFVRVLYRRRSAHNFLLVAENCNSYCLMCSQPPRPVDDLAKVDEHLRAIELMDRETGSLGLTGGEPTLLGDRLLEIIERCKVHLPRTALHVLTNGRAFADASFARSLAGIGHPDLMLGIPLYSDVDFEHDYVVQSPAAFDETVMGLYALGEAGVPVEIRVVLHRQTCRRLPRLAEFIARNFPFASQIALMGLEVTGLTLAHPDELWIDPAEYQRELRFAVEHLEGSGMAVRLYNHQLCVLDRRLWAYAVKSISDWKRAYLEACERCLLREACGGVFETSHGKHSAHLRPVMAN